MHSIPLSSAKLKTLTGKSSGSRSKLKQLCRISVCSRWLKANRIPCWGNPSPEGYSLMFSDSSRILICSYNKAELSLDTAAKAGCFGAVAVEMAESLESGKVKGFIPIGRFPAEFSSPCNLSLLDLEPPEDFLHYLYKPAGYLRTLFIFSARLLLFGEPYPPEWGTEEAAKFTPALTGLREE